MRLLFLRHAIAAPNEHGDMPDEARPLTAEGRRSFEQTAKALARVMKKPRAILTSPLLRARQTADIVAHAWGAEAPIIAPALVKGSWPGICRALAPYKNDDAVALVGHETWISTITAQLLDSKSHRCFDYRKGGVALIDVESLARGRGTLQWFIPPRLFRHWP